MSTAIVAGAALLASTSLTIAQMKEGPGGPGGGAGGPPAGAGPRGGSEGAGPGAAPPERAAPPSRAPATERDRGPRATAPAREPNRSAEPKERNKERPAAQAPDRDKKAEQGDRKRAEPTDQDRKKAEPGRQERRATERGQDKQERRPGTAGQQPDGAKKAEGGRDAQQAQKHEEARSARERLSSDQRTDLRGKFDRRGARAGGAKFSVHIGAHVPRRVRLYAVPAAVLAIVPAYSAYRYVVVEDEIIIVDPATYEVVDVIEERSQQASRNPNRIELRLTSDQRALVLDSIGNDYEPANVRVRLALGAEIPRNIELHSFSGEVVDSVPELRKFRFVVAERDVVIVDPGDRSVALVIER
jgi:hypothetical protein